MEFEVEESMKRSLVLAGLIVAVWSAPAAASPVTPASVTAFVQCSGNPERATITNNTGSAITIYSVGSTYQPRSGEPYYVNKTLKAHKSFTHESGTAATTHVLTHQFLYNDDVRDRVRFKTSVGKIVDHCG
jgi:hypothetical protein